MRSHQAHSPLLKGPTPPNPYLREGGSGAREREGKPDKAGQGEQARMVVRGSQEQSTTMWEGVSRNQTEGAEEQREGFIVFGEKEKENSPERTREWKQNGLSNKEKSFPAQSSPMAPHCPPDKVRHTPYQASRHPECPPYTALG